MAQHCGVDAKRSGPVIPSVTGLARPIMMTMSDEVPPDEALISSPTGFLITWGFIVRNPPKHVWLQLLVPYSGPDQRKFSTSTRLLPAWSICVYKIQRPSGETEIAVLLELSRLVPRGNSYNVVERPLEKL